MPRPAASVTASARPRQTRSGAEKLRSSHEIRHNAFLIEAGESISIAGDAREPARVRRAPQGLESSRGRFAAPASVSGVGRLQVRHLSASELSPDLAQQWADLLRCDPVFASPFFHPEFTRAVARVNTNVELGIVEDGGRALAFLPFERVGRRLGAPVGRSLSDYHGIVAGGGLDPHFDPLALLRACRLDCWDFSHLPVAQALIGDDRLSRLSSPQIELGGAFDAYVRRMGANGSRVFERAAYLERRLTREIGPLRFVARDSDRSVFARLLQWKSAQYRRTGEIDVLRSAAARDLLDTLRDAQLADFAGVLSALYAGDRLVAAHFGLKSGSCWHYWFPAYDVAFSRYSPGQLLLLAMAKEAPALGVRTIDLGAGDQPYKARLATRSIPLCAGSLQRPGWVAVARGVRRSLCAVARRAPFAQAGRAWLRQAFARVG